MRADPVPLWVRRGDTRGAAPAALDASGSDAPMNRTWLAVADALRIILHAIVLIQRRGSVGTRAKHAVADVTHARHDRRQRLACCTTTATISRARGGDAPKAHSRRNGGGCESGGITFFVRLFVYAAHVHHHVRMR